jgi:hypothetical protein
LERTLEVGLVDFNVICLDKAPCDFIGLHISCPCSACHANCRHSNYIMCKPGAESGVLYPTKKSAPIPPPSAGTFLLAPAPARAASCSASYRFGMSDASTVGKQTGRKPKEPSVGS